MQNAWKQDADFVFPVYSFCLFVCLLRHHLEDVSPDDGLEAPDGRVRDADHERHRDGRVHLGGERICFPRHYNNVYLI